MQNRFPWRVEEKKKLHSKKAFPKKSDISNINSILNNALKTSPASQFINFFLYITAAAGIVHVYLTRIHA